MTVTKFSNNDNWSTLFYVYGEEIELFEYFNLVLGMLIYIKYPSSNCILKAFF